MERPNGSWLHVSEFRPLLHPYLLWSAKSNKEVCHAFVQIGKQGVKEYVKAWERQELRLELVKWGPSEKYLQSGRTSPSKRKRSRPRDSKQKQSQQTLWIGFPP
ncbi:hypothetical protein SUGI_0791970 [Cryptomeria japonica]|nr:hypothetical protein SUGI_0791970 [Cryptomeria japonica]